MHHAKASQRMLGFSSTKSLDEAYRKYEFPSSASTRTSSLSEKDAAQNSVTPTTPEQFGLTHDMAVITGKSIKNSRVSSAPVIHTDYGLIEGSQDICNINETTQQVITESHNSSNKRQLQSKTAATNPNLHEVINKLNGSKNDLVACQEERTHQEILNANLSYILASEGFYYSSKKNRILPVTPDGTENNNLTELKFHSDEEDFYEDIFESSLKVSNPAQAKRLSALRLSIDRSLSRSAPIPHTNTHSNNLFQGFMDYSPEELFNHLSPQELKGFNKKSPQVNCDVDEVDVPAQPKGRRREMSVIANRKSSYFHTSSKRPRTDYSPSKDSSLNTDSYNSFLNELYVNLGMNPSDSKNDEKDLFRSMANTNESTTSLKLQKSHFEDIEKHFAYSVKSVDTPALQYGPDVPRSKDDSHASKSLSDGFPPVHTPGLSVFGTSFANDGAAKTVNNKLNESALDTSPEIDNKVNEPVSNVFVKSASSVHSRDLLKNGGREKEQDKNITDTSTLRVDGGLDNITLGAFDHTEKTSAPEPPMFSDIPSQTEETLMGPANTCIEFSNPVSQNTGNLREVPFDSALEDEQSANMTNRARNSPMFTMSVREESHIPSKPSWYITPHSHQNTAISGMSTNITDPLLDTALFATKSAGGMPVSSIYFYVDRETEPLAPKVGTGELVDEHLEVTASKFSKEDGEEIIEKKHIGSMDSMKSSTVDWKRKYTQQVEHNFAGCFEEIDEFVQEFDARTKDIVNNATAAAAAAAAAAVISANTTPAFSEDDISTFSSFKNDSSAGLRVKPTITSSSTDQSITIEKKFSTISDLKRSFSKDARKLKTQQSKEFGSIKPLQPVSESSSAKNETTKRSKSITSYDDAIEELSQEIGTLKSEENNRISSHSNKSSMEASSKSSLDNTDDSIHTTKTRKKASPSTDSTDKAVEITKSDNGSGKKLRGVFHAVTFKVRSKFGSDKKVSTQ